MPPDRRLSPEPIMCAGFFALFVVCRDVPSSSLAGGSLRERRRVTVRNGVGLATTSAVVLAAQSGRARGSGSSQRRLPLVPSAESTQDDEGEDDNLPVVSPVSNRICPHRCEVQICETNVVIQPSHRSHHCRQQSRSS